MTADAEAAEDRRRALLAQVEAAAEMTLGSLETMLAETGVDIDAVLAALRAEAGQGGPFVAAEALSADVASADQAAALSAMLDLERVNLLRIAAARMPFGEPVTAPRYTSAFGPRRDPINGRRGFHEGLDIAGRSGTPIRAAADGVVSFSGWMRGYGRVVKIRHDFGFETVYAHLRRARVSVGQTVARGARIGDMGNTGRSTGTHLHYEVRVEGKPVDPMRFIKAARNVL
jgi:Membrane proteins related to metalloendopeptidases